MSRTKRKSLLPRLLALLLLLCLAGGGFLYWQQTGIQPETIPVSSSRLPAAFDGLRISLVSDVHCAQFGVDNEALLSAVAAQQPDLIAVTGDLLDRFHPDFSMVEPLARGLAEIAPTYFVTGNHEWAFGTAAVRELKQGYAASIADGLSAVAPTFYVTGNHEWARGDVPELKDTLTEHGVTVLSNEYLTLERDGQILVLAGIDDPNGYADQKTLEELTAEIRQDLGDPFILLLAHRNNDYPLYAQCGVDVTLCGHGHGGIIRLPFTDGLLSTDRTLFPDHTAGLYQLSQGQLVVSRGLGNSGPSLRLFNRPHLPLVILQAQ